MIRRVMAAAAAALLLTACGSDDVDGRYDAQVAQIRQAVEAGDRDGAHAAIEQLGQTAFHAHAAGDVSDDELAELAVLLDQARVQVDEALPAPAPPTTVPTTAPPTAPPPAAVAVASDDDDEDEDEEKGEKKEDRGRGGDDGEDDDDD